MRFRALLAALALLLGPAAGAVAAGAATSGADAASGHRVLVLHSYYKGYKWADDKQRGITSASSRRSTGGSTRTTGSTSSSAWTPARWTSSSSTATRSSPGRPSSSAA